MRKLTLLLLAAVIFVSVNVANAGIYFEPYFGSLVSGEISGETYDAAYDLDNDNEKTVAVTGSVYGARVGMDFINVAMGLDYMAGSPSFDGDSSTLTNMGIFFAFKIPMVRFWAEYIFSAKVSSTNDDDETATFDKGTGTKIGVGYSPIPYLSINFEVLSNTFTEVSIEDENGDDILDAANLDWKDHENKLSAYMLSISVPI
jgi:hypothetical protein